MSDIIPIFQNNVAHKMARTLIAEARKYFAGDVDGAVSRVYYEQGISNGILFAMNSLLENKLLALLYFY